MNALGSAPARALPVSYSYTSPSFARR
jgi:hypothetical protein